MGRRKTKNSSTIEAFFSNVGMEEKEALQAFETLARTCGVDVRYEKGDFKSGLCRLYEKHVIVIQKDMPDSKKVVILARDLHKFDMTGIYVMPQLLAIMRQVQTELISEESLSVEEK